MTVLGSDWLILAARLIQLQWWQQEKFAGKAEQQRELIEEISARPGDIVDRQGRLLATTLTTRSLFVVGPRITDLETICGICSSALADAAGNVLGKSA